MTVSLKYCGEIGVGGDAGSNEHMKTPFLWQVILVHIDLGKVARVIF